MIEIWKDIAGFEGKYQVSNLGNVKSLNYNNTNKEELLKPRKRKDNGILDIALCKKGKPTFIALSRVVFATFTEIKLNRNTVVMHKDGNKNNCSLDNLYIISRSERRKLAFKEGKIYQPRYKFYGQMLTRKEISEITGISVVNINNRLRLKWNIYETIEIPITKRTRKNKKEGDINGTNNNR